MAELGGSEAAGAGAMSAPEGTWPSLNDIGAELLFEKVLTSCDAASRGRIVLPKKAAVEHFACQDGKVGLTVHCEDTFGNEHTILHRFWTNSKSRMYLLEGLESVLRVYKVSPGDVLLFGRMPSGKMVVCARPPGPGDVQRSRRAVNGTGVATDKPAKVKQPSVPAVATRRQKRARLLERAASVDSESSQEGADYFQPRPDGIFRAVPPSSSALEPQVLDHEHFWSATADVGGELYQAFFDTAAGAFDAFVTAGHNLPDDLAAAAYAYEQEQQAAAAAAAEADASAEPDELEAEDVAADSEAAEQLYMEGDGLAGSGGAADAEAQPAVASRSLPATSAAPDLARYAANDAHLQAAAERQQMSAETEVPANAAAMADTCGPVPGNTTAELPAADSRTTAAAGPEAAAAHAPDRLAAAAGQGVGPSSEPAGAVEVDIWQAVPVAAAVAADTQRQPPSGVMPLADALQEAPPAASVAAGSEAAGDRAVPAAAAEVSENGVKSEPDSADGNMTGAALPARVA